MARVGDLLSINYHYLGTHTMRKTGAYRVYTQSNYNIGLVIHLLNHSSEAMTLTYLGLDQASRDHVRSNWFWLNILITTTAIVTPVIVVVIKISLSWILIIIFDWDDYDEEYIHTQNKLR